MPKKGPVRPTPDIGTERGQPIPQIRLVPGHMRYRIAAHAQTSTHECRLVGQAQKNDIRMDRGRRKMGRSHQDRMPRLHNALRRGQIQRYEDVEIRLVVNLQIALKHR